MNTELRNRIKNELREFMGRDPKENEIMNAQTDHIIMAKVKERSDFEEIYFLQEAVFYLLDRLESVEKSVEVINNDTSEGKVLN